MLIDPRRENTRFDLAGTGHAVSCDVQKDIALSNLHIRKFLRMNVSQKD
jgi:hypothetical protein